MNTNKFAVSSKTLLNCAVCLALIAGVVAGALLNHVAADDEGGKTKGLGETIKFGNGESITFWADGSATTSDGTAVEGVMPHGKVASVKSSPSTIRPDEGEGRFSLGAENDPPIKKWLYEMLEKPVPALDFPDETPVSEVLGVISTHFNEKYGKMDDRQMRMTFWPDISELDLQGITSLEDVMIWGITLDGTKLRYALKLIFDQTTEPELTFKVDYGVIMVTTRKKIESGKDVYTRAYRVGELSTVQVAARDDDDSESLPNLVTLIVEMTQPELKWAHRDEEGGSIRLVGQTLVVKQSSIGHRRIVGLLNMLALAEAPVRKTESPTPTKSH